MAGEGEPSGNVPCHQRTGWTLMSDDVLNHSVFGCVYRNNLLKHNTLMLLSLCHDDRRVHTKRAQLHTSAV